MFVSFGLVQDAGRLCDEASCRAAAGCWRAALVLIDSALEPGVVATACRLEPQLQDQGHVALFGRVLAVDARAVESR